MAGSWETACQPNPGRVRHQSLPSIAWVGKLEFVSINATVATELSTNRSEKSQNLHACVHCCEIDELDRLTK
jgi:hypothetical protein